MAQRLELQALLEDLVGSRNVYFQPGPDIEMAYPCIVYTRSRILARWANNFPYFLKDRYMLTVIDRDPDSPIVRTVAGTLPLCSYDRSFAADELNHSVFTIYF
jgi:hypothetical protein